MKIPSPFDYFDPKTGAPPAIGGTNLVYATEHARKVLEKRSSDDIKYAMQILNWMLHQERRDLIIETMKRKKEDTSYLSPTFILRYQMELFNIAGQKDFPEAAWAEYFAILSLALVGNVFRPPLALRSNKKLTELEIRDRYREYATQLSKDAMEAICYAEMLLEKKVDEPLDESRDRIRVADAMEEIRSHEQREQLKSEFLQFCLANKFSSKAEAAQAYLEQLSPDKKSALQDSTSVATLADALRSFENAAEAFEAGQGKSHYSR